MARIRTIKPEFFTSEDIVGLQPLTRLLYIAIWCEADKEGRLVWKPVTFKLRYFPGDSCDIQSMCKEIVDAGLVKLYGDGYAVIPSFKAHQHINPRESESQLPEPVAIATRKARVTTRQQRDDDAQGGREGKGKERKEEDDATRPFVLPAWIPKASWDGYVEMRAKKRVPMTDRARDLRIADLQKFHDEGHDVGAILDKSTSNGWTDVYASKEAAKAPAADSSWLTGTPFATVFDANNAGCYAHNAANFRTGIPA